MLNCERIQRVTEEKVHNCKQAPKSLERTVEWNRHKTLPDLRLTVLNNKSFQDIL